LLQLKETLDWKVIIDDDDLNQLLRDRIITRDYIKREFILNIPFYKDDLVNFQIPVVENIDDKIDEYRTLFRGVRIGNMGNKQNVIGLMKKFLIENPDVTYNEIISATLYYIQNTDFQYIMNAENFIYKMDNTGKMISKLQVVLEEYKLTSKETNLL
jgi:hypothetical protein